MVNQIVLVAAGLIVLAQAVNNAGLAAVPLDEAVVNGLTLAAAVVLGEATVIRVNDVNVGLGDAAVAPHQVIPDGFSPDVEMFKLVPKLVQVDPGRRDDGPWQSWLGDRPLEGGGPRGAGGDQPPPHLDRCLRLHLGRCREKRFGRVSLVSPAWLGRV